MQLRPAGVRASGDWRRSQQQRPTAHRSQRVVAKANLVNAWTLAAVVWSLALVFWSSSCRSNSCFLLV